MVAPTTFSRVSLGFDPARGDQTPVGDTGPWFSVGSNNFVGIRRISAGTVAVGAIALTAIAQSSATTFAVAGSAAGDILWASHATNTGVVSQMTGGVNIRSHISEAGVGALTYSATTTTNPGVHIVRWTHIGF